MMKKKDFSKFTKRNTHKRRSKEQAKSALMKALRDIGVDSDKVKVADIDLDIYEKRTSPKRKNICDRGIFRSSKGSYGFVTLENVERDIFIPGDSIGGAIDGDFVEVVYHKYNNYDGDEKTEGRVTKVLQMGRRTVIGTLCEDMRRHGRRYLRVFYIEPDDAKLSSAFPVRDLGGARIGEKVEALILRDGSSSPACDIIRVFGAPEDMGANYQAILAECDIVTEFTDAELDQAESLAAEPISYDGREDLTGEVIFTIDGEGAKDLDDAVSLRRLPGGRWRLGVHIADVSYYVAERTPLDRCVMQRGTSVYFTDKVVPMLPPALSNGACSLNSGEDKYTLSAIIDLDSEGNIENLQLKSAIINSRVRGVYSEVNALLSGNATSEIKKKYKTVLPTLERMAELYSVLLEKSKQRGAIDFDADEAVIILSPDGTPTHIERRERGLSERIIEQFMLTANEAVASYLTRRGIPCVYRVHEAPPPEHFADFLSYLESLGFDVRELRKHEPTPRDLANVLEIAEQKGLLPAVSYTMLRSMAKAKYSESRPGHFGLGIEEYCHFTSPIRRLSDLATHRIIRRVLFENKRAELYTSYAKRAAAAATEGELRAISAERRIEDLYKVIFMSDRVGESFEGTVCSITSFGMFVTLDNTCEGLIPISTLPGVYTFDERNLTLRSRYHSYRIADRISVRLEEANVIRGKLRFSVIEE
ncbi:MAG: ribonuclease R [Clostridia bacterium]|nr:ribonuclease R [Clostridia bacterium]